MPVILVGNKIDLEQSGQRRVSPDEGQTLANKFGCKFVETSAAHRRHVDDVFHTLIREIRRQNVSQSLRVTNIRVILRVTNIRNVQGIAPPSLASGWAHHNSYHSSHRIMQRGVLVKELRESRLCPSPAARTRFTQFLTHKSLKLSTPTKQSLFLSKRLCESCVRPRPSPTAGAGFTPLLDINKLLKEW